MRIDASAVQYFLEREFGEVTGEGLHYRTMFDYPVLYDSSADMRGHIVLIPAFERPEQDIDLEGTLCVCVSDKSAKAARAAGAAVAQLEIKCTFQHFYNRVQHIFVKNERFEARLRAFVDTYAGFQPMLDACEAAMGYPCALIDDQFRLVCKSSSGEGVARGQDEAFDIEALEPSSVDLFMGSRTYRRLRASRKVFVIPGSEKLMMKNVFSGDDLVGSLVIEHKGDRPSARYARFLLDYLTPFVAEAYSRIGSFGLATLGAGHVKSAIPDALAGDPTAFAKLEAALIEGGHKRNTRYVVLRIERSFTNEGVEEREYLAHRFEIAFPQAYCFSEGNNLFMLADIGLSGREAGRDFLRELPLIARDNLSKVGISKPFDILDDFTAARVQATIALQQGSQVDPTAWCYRFSDYALSWLASRALRDTEPEHVCHPALVTIARYDNAHGTDLLETLRVFMACRYNASLAAQELFVARSTLLNRLERIKELTQVDLDDFRERTYLAFSLEALSS